jgi:hypothetical protein
MSKPHGVFLFLIIYSNRNHRAKPSKSPTAFTRYLLAHENHNAGTAPIDPNPEADASASPSSGFMVPFSTGQSLYVFVSTFVMARNFMAIPKYFLLVLICPTLPQFAHFRVVPTDLKFDVEGESGESGDIAALSANSPFCFSRATRRSLFRESLASSSSMLIIALII